MNNISNTIAVYHNRLDCVLSLSHVVQQAGFDVVQLGQEAPPKAERIQQIGPLLLLLDASQPNTTDLYALCQELQQLDRNFNLPIIFISDQADTAQKVRAFDVGAVDYMTPPFEMVEAMSRVQTHIKSYYQQAEIQRLREAEQRHFKALNKIRDDLLHTTTHDLKNPLSVINSYAHLLASVPGLTDLPKASEYVQQIMDSAGQMQQLIEGLLDIARLETGMGIQLKLHHLPDIVEKYVKTFRATADDKHITLLHTPPDDMLFAELDEIQLGRVLSNLLSNAIKYTPAQGRVDVRVSRHADDPTYAEIIVQDTGIGIPKRELPYIFDKFYRVKAQDHRQQKGSGLGLAVAQVIIQQHNGEITVASQLKQGTTFTIRLPLYEG